MASVGKHIKRLRTERRMTQEELAEQLHVTRQAVSAWETGKSLPGCGDTGAHRRGSGYGRDGGHLWGKERPGPGGPEAEVDS